jgi:hypothetical protein
VKSVPLYAGGAGEARECLLLLEPVPRHGKVDVRLPGEGNSHSHGAGPVYYNMEMMWWIWTSMLSIQNCLSLSLHAGGAGGQVTKKQRAVCSFAGGGGVGGPVFPSHRSTSLVRNASPPRTPIGPYE